MYTENQDRSETCNPILTINTTRFFLSYKGTPDASVDE
jgi:hypothetical protein